MEGNALHMPANINKLIGHMFWYVRHSDNQQRQQSILDPIPTTKRMTNKKTVIKWRKIPEKNVNELKRSVFSAARDSRAYTGENDMQEFSCESKPLFAAKINENATKYSISLLLIVLLFVCLQRYFRLIWTLWIFLNWAIIWKIFGSVSSPQFNSTIAKIGTSISTAAVTVCLT